MGFISRMAPEGATKRLNGLLLALLVVAVVWTGKEIPGYGYALLMDDDINILFNEHLGTLDGARLWWMFSDISYVARYLPLGWLSFDLAVLASDLSPAACHVAGLSFHVLNAIVILFCLRILLERFAPSATPLDRALGASLGALVWALHPLRVEPVAWCSGLIYVEGGFFALVAVYARLRELKTRSAGGGQPLRWFALGVASFALSLLTYPPVALFLPGALGVLDYAWFKKAKRGTAPSCRTLRWELAAFVGLSGMALGVTLLAGRTPLAASQLHPTLAEFGLAARFFQAGYVWASYVWRTVWPVDLTPVVEALFTVRAGDARIWGAFPTLAVLTWLSWRWRRTAPFFGACWLGYLLWMVPVLGLTVHPHVAADRYSYLGSVLFSVALVLGILRVRSASTRAVLFLFGAVIAAVCAGLSVRQAGLWRDALTMHRQVLVRLNDGDLRNIALVRIAKLQFLAGEVRDGRARAEKIYAEAPHVAGVARVWHDIAPAHPLSPEVASSPLQEWRAAPWACLHEQIAVGQLAKGYPHDALVRLNAALALSPDFVSARFRRALLLAMLGDPRSALHDWLVMETRGSQPGFDAGGLRFAAEKIAAAFQVAGEEHLAAALRQRAAGAANGPGGRPAP